MKLVDIEIGLDEVDDESALRKAVARQLKRRPESLPDLSIVRRSLDARRGAVKFCLRVAVGTPPTRPVREPRQVKGERRVVIVGDGPAGLFCAYELARHAVPCLVIDRGHQVQPRRRDLKRLNRAGEVDVDSNYCFGEGGAGTYSDGKLYTRAKKRGDVMDVLDVLIDNGAPADIAVDARPHIGSNRLPKVVTALRERLEAAGITFRFGARVTDLDVTPDRRMRGVVVAGGETIGADAVVLATGHSARDVYELLLRAGVELEPKAFALGVRIEHPQPLINEIQYGRAAGHPRLPAASYRLARDIDGRGVFSFCMCPGGFIVPATTEPASVVVNGMSLSRRDSPFANSGLVVAIEPADLARAGFQSPLAGIEFQRRIERAAFDAGGGSLRAPAVRVADFLAGRTSTALPATSYQPGIAPADVAALLDSAGVALSGRLADGLRYFGQRMRGYVTNDAVLVGVESRTSSPVRVPRHPDSLDSPSIAGLYPCGEGAGYAGGIVSAAMDGMRVARAIVASYARG